MTEYRTPSGKILTDADIERLADEAEAGYDVSHLIGKPSRDLESLRRLVRKGEEGPHEDSAGNVEPG